MNLYSFILPLGIISYSLLLLTILTGARVIKVKISYHKLLGILTLITVTLHASLAIYLSYF